MEPALRHDSQPVLPEQRLLLAEDDAHTCRLVQEVLSEAGFDVDAFSDGESAWRAQAGAPGRYAAVVLDRHMPRLTGMEMLRRMKDDAALRDVPVIFLTGLDSKADIVAGIQAGAYYYVTKPFDPDLLTSTLRAAVAKREAHLELAHDLHKKLAAVHLLREAEFHFREPAQARALAALVASAAPSPRRVVTGLWELMSNAIEHGNLELSYADKSTLLSRGAWQAEVQRRGQTLPYAARYATLYLHCDERRISFRVTDQGAGFDPSAYLDVDPSRATHAHGRGIAMARLTSFDELKFNGRGNDVEAIVYR